ncbi:peptidase M23 [Arthrobacter sp. MYb23]|uniref:M23 family metallopeptidase n=1 Tax=unclassified Arthrobacter TaxID=235627 RepID=UPI000CFB90CC|nr:MULTISPECIES: M23 family metallopeptidase [unclassified Arthrobacter]PRB39230.1 peptidase M23 [Arthrobacter sp. MYb51]PRB93270.1 peptidase M23 [Arthrobacter sp. MYb23]
MTVAKLTLTALLAATLFAGSASAPAPASASWSWPLPPKPSVLRTFDPPDKPWLSGHRGVDLGPTSDGAPVTAPSDGVVAFAGVVVDRPVLTIDHGDGLKSSFEPVTSELKAGDAVRKGQVIGTTDPGHCSSAPCLHWGVRRGEDYVNPLGFVEDLRPSILLPLH